MAADALAPGIARVVFVFLVGGPQQSGTFQCRRMIDKANISFMFRQNNSVGKGLKYQKPCNRYYTRMQQLRSEPRQYVVRHIREYLRYRTRPAMSNIRNAFGVYPHYSQRCQTHHVDRTNHMDNTFLCVLHLFTASMQKNTVWRVSYTQCFDITQILWVMHKSIVWITPFFFLGIF